jgi:hypothetical protein
LKADRKILSDTEIEKIIKETDATLAIEGLEGSEFTKQVYREFAKGEITEEEALQKLKENVMRDTELHFVEYEVQEERLGKPLFYVD